MLFVFMLTAFTSDLNLVVSPQQYHNI